MDSQVLRTGPHSVNGGLRTRLDGEFVAAFNLAPALVRRMDGVILFCTQGSAAVYGWSAAEMLGRCSHELFQTEFSEPLPEIERQLRERGSWTGELKRRRSDGSTFWVLSHWALRPGEDGGPDLVLEFSQDISAQKLAEANLAGALDRSQRLAGELVASEERLRLALAASSAGVWEWDLSTCLMDWSPEVWKLCGLEPKGRTTTFDAWLETLVPEQRKPAKRKLTAALRAGAPVLLQWQVDGNLRWLTAEGRPTLDEKGNAVRYSGIVYDVTERKLQEERHAQAARREALLSGITARLLASADPQALVGELASCVMQELSCGVFFNYLVDENRGCLRLNACAGIPEESAREIEWLEFGEAVCGAVARDGKPAACEFITHSADPRVALVRSFGVRAYACHPLISGGTVLGTLSFGSLIRDKFDAADLELMRAVTGHIAIAMERLRAQEKLRASEARLRDAQRMARLGDWTYNPRPGRIELSDESLRILEIEPTSFGGAVEELLQQVHPADRAEVLAVARRTLETGDPGGLDHRLLLSGDRVKHVHTQCNAYFDASGRLARAAGTIQDITMRRLAEDASRRFELLAAHSRDVILFIRKRDHRILEANAAAARAYGYTREELRSLTIDDLRPGERRNVDAQINLADNQTLLFEAVHRRKDGSTFHVEVNSQGVDLNGDRVLLSVIRDITIRKQREEKILRQNAVLAAISHVFEVALNYQDEAGLGAECLKVAASLTGSADAVMVEMTDDGRLVQLAEHRSSTGLDAAANREDVPAWLVNDVLSTGAAVFSNEPGAMPGRQATLGGRAASNFLGASLVHGDKPLAVVIMANKPGGYSEADSESLRALAPAIVQALMRRRAEQAVRARDERLRHAQKLESIGLLAGGVAHDFNNLLVGVIGNASLALEMLPEDSPMKELLHRVVRSGEQAAHLTRQMLAYSGKGRFVIERVTLSGLVREVADLVQSSAPKKVRVKLDLAPNLPAVQADRGQMQQVVMNLAINAIEAIGVANGEVTLRTGIRDVDRHFAQSLHQFEITPGRYVFLEAVDNGCGMDAATVCRVFEPFFSTKFTGRGLGLAAVSGIVRGHRGAITVNSAPGRGSSFLVLLPASAESAADPVEAAWSEGDFHGVGCALIVDDEEVVRNTARHALERRGYEVALAASGMEAIETLRRRPGDIELVILDLSMPGMSGEEALPELLAIKPDLAVIVSSGYAEPDALRQFAGMPVAGFIQKPYTVQQLAWKVKTVLDARRSS